MTDMKTRIKRLIHKVAPYAFAPPQGDEGIAKVGHRNYVGGLWDEIGQLQFDFLVSHGLKPQHRLLDIACGSLRLGVKAIPYLEPEHYLGIDKEAGLIQAGLEKELDAKVRDAKKPAFVVSSSFEFEKLPRTADYAIAQSLFTHLPPPLIDLCFQKLRPCLEDDGVFFATFSPSRRKMKNLDQPHDHARFGYTQAEMCEFGERSGFRARYIGNWKHPRGQVMVEYRKKLGPAVG
jgi:hypothetical protein